MKLHHGKFPLTFAAAAVAYGLATAPTLAQQGGAQGSQERSQQGAQQSGSQERQSGSQQQGAPPSGQQQSQAASGQQSNGDRFNRVVQQHAELETFVNALETAGLTDSLASDTSYTIFAPTNQAFESMRQDVAELLKPENREQLVSLLRAHIVADDVSPERARQLSEALTIDGDTIELSAEDDKLMVNDASVETPNIQVEGANVRIYTIDEVLGQGRQQSASAPDRRNRG
jgi:uncharacterized surface protein with fasciclin (FAS1) repeats